MAFRHVLVLADYLWTGEAERLSWSMRLKGKVCDIALKKNEGEWRQPDARLLSFWQKGNLDDPYFLWLFVQKTQCDQGSRVFARVVCRAIGRVPSPLIRSEVDLCHSEYTFLRHNDWIYPFPGDLDLNYRQWFETSSRVKPE